MDYPKDVSGAPFYLRPEVKIEPLVCRWNAWPHLIAPAQCAMNVTFRHLRHLQSFVANPRIHIAAARDPSLMGGPFVSLTEADVPAVRRLIQLTEHLCAKLVAFAEDLKQFNEKLQTAAKGYGLAEMYNTIPQSLAGLVELTYDLNNHPGIRVLEEWLYDDALDTRQCQEIGIHSTPSIDRAFFMSTPMLDRHDRLFIQIPFADDRIDELTSARIAPVELEDLAGSLKIRPDELRTFHEFFTTAAPVRNCPEYTHPNSVRVRYFGHACVLIQSSKVSVLLDPLTAWERDSGEGTLTFSDLPDFIDFIVITHCHQDHCVPEVLLQLRKRVGCVLVPRNDAGNLADPSLRLILRALGFNNTYATVPFEPIAIPEGAICALPFFGEHADLNINSKQCVSLKIKGRSFVFLVDSDVPGSIFYERLSQRIGPVDALFVGMECHGAPLTWLYGPLLTRPIGRKEDDSRRLVASNAERAWNAAHTLRCSRAYVYAMGQEPWLKQLMGMQYSPGSIQIIESDRFLGACRDANINAKRLMGCCEFVL